MPDRPATRLVGQPGPDLRSQQIHRAYDAMYAPRRPATIFANGDKGRLFELVARTIGDVPVTYLEFGVHQGASIDHMARLFRHPRARFVGFDSFEGLPEAWGGMSAGSFSTQGVAPSPKDGRVSFVKGWFQDTVQPFLAANPLSGPVLVNYDADLYSSTLFLMATLHHHVGEYHFLFDEYFPAEIVAMYDFSRAFPIEYELFAALEDERHWPFQVFGRLRKTPFRLAQNG